MTLGEFRELTQGLTDEAEIKINMQEEFPTKAELKVEDGSVYVSLDIIEY